MPIHSRDLHLHEQLLLLALRDDKGTPDSRAGSYRFAMAGAILAELALEGRITIGEDKKHMVELVSDTPMGDEILDECLTRIATSKRRQRASTWVSRFSGTKRFLHRTAEGLCRKGVLKDREDQILLIFKRTAYPTIDPGPEQELISLLRDAIFGESRSLDPRLVVIAALANATGVLRVPFDKKELKARKDRLEEIAQGELAAAATREAIAAVQAAQAAMIVIMSASVATTAST